MPVKPKILLVEDESPKLTHISALLQKLAPTAHVVTARSVTSALRLIESEEFELLILDMSLPTFDIGERESGGRPQGFGGTEILRHASMAERLGPTIIITGYEGFLREGGEIVNLEILKAELIDEFEEHIVEVLHYNSAYDRWKLALKSSLNSLGIIGEEK
ncbi:hypothetical protein [Hwanghaeella sp. LZ110]|uniref:hypothetical protein n=1 Tax=Hwanghaeella sp. LZ110 TaxID=3402810 RepID=UPI003B6766EB